MAEGRVRELSVTVFNLPGRLKSRPVHQLRPAFGGSLGSLRVSATSCNRSQGAPQPVRTYTLERLQNRGYVSGSTITLPVAEYMASNSLDIQLQFDGQFTQTLPLEVATEPFADPMDL